MRRLVGKGFESTSDAFSASMRWLWEKYPACYMCDLREHYHRYAKYIEVVGKPYRVYFFETNPCCYDAYFFSTPEEARAEIEKRKKAKWKNLTVASPLNE